jgi:phage protein D
MAEAENSVPHYRVYVGGAPLAVEAEVDILGVTVSQYVEGADVFTIEVNNWHSDRQELKWVDEDLYAPGAEVEVKIGFLDDVRSLIRGEVTALEPEFHPDKAPTLKVTGYDRLHRFRRGRRTRSFVDIRDSELAESLAAELSLRARVEDTSVVHPYLFQNNQSNIDFLRERARRIRYEVDVEDRTLVFRRSANGAGKTVTLTLGDKLKGFYPRLTTLDQVSEVEVRGWDPVNKSAIVATAGLSDQTTKMQGTTAGPALADEVYGATSVLIADHYLVSQAEADQIAKAQFNVHADGFITGEATAIGNPELAAGTVVELTKLGRRFTGFYYITAASHVIKREGYVTHLALRRNAI